MFDKLLGLPAHKYLQITGVFILAVGLPLNKVLMSIGTIWLAANLILNADFRTYWIRWKRNPVFWFILGILLLHIIGLFYTSDLGYAFRDFRTKLPFFVIPASLIAFPIEKKYIHFVLYGFLISLSITSIINWTYLYTLTTQGEIVNFRDISLFGSHIRYGLLIVMGLVVSIYFLFKQTKHFYIWIPVSIWFVYYTYIGQVFGAYIALVFAITGLIIYGISQIEKTLFRWGSFIVLFGLVAFGAWQVTRFFTPNSTQVVFGDLPKFTAEGNPYYHDTTLLWFENSHHVMSYISEKELSEIWQKRSDIPYDSLDYSGHQVKFTLIRYMSSKGLKKDREGIKKLTQNDIKNIEKGVASIQKASNSPVARFENFRNEIYKYAKGGDPDGNSLLQRLEHWKAAVHIIENHWFLGVGTGDIQKAFNNAYRETNTKLDRENWNRTHNQFLTFWISFGIVGFILFLILWIYLFSHFYIRRNLLGLCFTLIAIASFLSEDTLETQQGVTFVALYIGLLCSMNPNSRGINHS